MRGRRDGGEGGGRKGADAKGTDWTERGRNSSLPFHPGVILVSWRQGCVLTLDWIWRQPVHPVGPSPSLSRGAAVSAL